jgi:beta-galactosidase GanA
MADIEAKRAKAYSDMESHLCDVVRMGEIASMLFDSPDQGQFVFAVTHLEDMLQDLRKRYYALDFPS